jgi:hypothetical protein
MVFARRIMAIRIRPACHQTQLPPYQNIIVTISSGPGPSRAAASSVPIDTPQG